MANLRTSSSRARASCLPSLETLETRETPAVVGSPVVDPNGVWTINFNSDNDIVRVTDSGRSGAGTVRIEVFNNGVRTANLLNARGVWQINLNTGGGNDDVRYSLTGALDAGGAREIRTNLGTGSDLFYGYVGSNLGASVIPTALAAYSRLDLIVNSGGDASMDRLWTSVSGDLAEGSQLGLSFAGDQGFDEMRIDALSDVDVGRNATFWMFLTGGSDGDIFDVDFRGEVDGRLELTAMGEAGYDTLDARLYTDAGSSGVVAALLVGGSDGDLFTHTTNVRVVDFLFGEGDYDQVVL